jgi:hypothetical protein
VLYVGAASEVEMKEKRQSWWCIARNARSCRKKVLLLVVVSLY